MEGRPARVPPGGDGVRISNVCVCHSLYVSPKYSLPESLAVVPSQNYVTRHNTAAACTETRCEWSPAVWSGQYSCRPAIYSYTALRARL